MAKTLVIDMFVPEKSEYYVLQRSSELNKFGNSGIIAHEPRFDRIAAGGGRDVKMPYFDDLTSPRQILSDSVPLNVSKITTGYDVARIQNDANAWSFNDLAGRVGGADPVAAALELLSGYWARMDQGIVIASLKGVFASASMAANRLALASESIAGQTAATRFSAGMFIDATQCLGDHGETLTHVGMHSATEASLRKQDLITTVRGSDGKVMLREFQGRAVIVDDRFPVRDGTSDGKVFTTFLFGQGVFARGTAPLSSGPLQGGIGTEGFEFARNGLASDTHIINRRRYILHPRGVRFSPPNPLAGESPSNTELEDGANWERVWDPKLIRVVAVEHNLAIN